MSDWMPDFLKLLEMRMQLNAQKNTNNKGPGPNVSGYRIDEKIKN